MARRKRKRARRSFTAVPLLLGLALAALVVWAVLPKHHAAYRRTHHRNVAAMSLASPAAMTSPSLTAPQSPAAAQSPVAQSSPAAETSSAPESSPQSRPSAAAVASPEAPAPAVARHAEVAIIIDDCGQWPATERGYLALPIPLTLSVLPHVAYSRAIAKQAADAGKGIMLHLPMEPLSHIVAGPGEIRTAMSDTSVTAQTENDLAQVPLASGVNNHEGSAASADPRIMKDVIDVVKAHDLFFIDSRTNPKSVGAAQAQQEGVPTASRDVFLDNRADVAYSESMLAQTVDIAKRNGTAIAIGHPKPTTLEALRLMYPRMQAQGVTFVLASQLVH